MFVVKCCVLSGRVLSDRPITRPEESYRLWFVVVRDLETSRMTRPWPGLQIKTATKMHIVESPTLRMTTRPLLHYGSDTLTEVRVLCCVGTGGSL